MVVNVAVKLTIEICVISCQTMIHFRCKKVKNLFMYRLLQVMNKEDIPSLESWLNCDTELCELTVDESGAIEKAGCDTLQVGSLSLLS